MYYNCFINLKNMLKILRKSQKERPTTAIQGLNQCTEVTHFKTGMPF